MLEDLRHALRRLRTRPSTSVLAVAMLAGGIGLATAMFTVVDALILRPAPFRDPATFVWLGLGTPTNFDQSLPLPTARALRSSHVFSATHAVLQAATTFDDAPPGADREPGAWVTPGLFEDLGVRPLLGRLFRPTEGGPGDDDRLLISETVWRTRFGGDPAVVGRRVRVSGTVVEIVGVLPGWVRFPFAVTSTWRPMNIDRPPVFGPRPVTSAYVFTRLPATLPRGVVADRAAEVVHTTDPTTRNKQIIFAALSHLDDYSAELVRLLAWGVGLVFLVLCANVTNLILVRVASRRAQLAVCAALGASRQRLLREVSLEHGILIGAASLGGFAVAVGLVALARSFLPSSIIQVTLHPLALDLRSLTATVICGALALVVAGVLPAWTVTSSETGARLASRQVTASKPIRRLTTLLIVGEVALAVALSVAAGLQLRTFVNLLKADQGFDVSHLVTLRVSLPAAHFADGPSRFVSAMGIVDTIQTLAGVQGASLSDGVPPQNGTIDFWDVQTDRPGAAPIHLIFHNYQVLPTFFDVLRISVVEGRTFQVGDPSTDVLLSATMAAKLFPGQSAVGHTLRFAQTTYRVIGMTSEIRNPLLDPRLDTPQFYRPLLAPDTTGTSPDLNETSVILTVRCTGACAPPEMLRAAVTRSAPLAVVGPPQRPLDAFMASLGRPRIGAILALAFAVTALLAFGGGLFAVLSRAVLERQREFGIRTTLGATPADLAWLVRARGALIAAAGLATGTFVAWLLSRTLAAAQYQVGTADPLVWTAVCATIGLAIVAASWRPARRAAQIDPVQLLRED